MNLHEAKKLAEELILTHKLYGWRFVFDGAKTRFGLCSYRNRTISLSRYLTLKREESFVRNTILHEIAHALVGCGNGHNSVWRNKALSIGCNGQRCGNDVSLKPSWVGTCPSCGVKVERFRRKNIACGKCCKGVYNKEFSFIWTKNI